MTPPPEPQQDRSDLREDVLGWFIRRQRDGWSAHDEATFQDWLAADARHRASFTQWEARWRALDAVPAAAVAQLRRNLQRDKAGQAASNGGERGPARPAAPQPEVRPRRRFLVPAAAVAVLAVATGTGLFAWNHWQAQPLFTQAFSTQRGQQLDVPLPDGSRLRLDTATQVQVHYYRQRREVRLLDGQALFSVQADAARPFDVLAGPVAVTVVGTRFSVRYTPQLPGDDGVRVSVEEGRVRVAGREGAAGDKPAPEVVDLGAGQQVRASAAGRLAPAVGLPDEGIAPWRNHRVSFVNTPLAQALAELERYGSTGLTVRDPAVAALRLSGTFDVRDPQTLRRVLPLALPVRLQVMQADRERTEVLAAR